MKKIIIISILLLLLLGYTPYHELNDLAVIDVMGLDYQNNKYFLYLNIISSKNKVAISSGDSLGEVFLNAKNTYNKKTYYKHLSTVIFSTDILSQEKNLFTFLKDEFTGIDYLTLATKDDMESLFNKFHKGNDYRSFLIKEKEDTAAITNTTFKDLLSYNLDDLKTASIPLIKNNNELTSNGLYVIEKNLVLDKELSKINNIINNKASTFNEKIKLDNKYYQTAIYDLNNNITYKNNKLKVKLTGKIDSPDTNNLKEIKKIMEEDLTKDIEILINKELTEKINISNLINYIYLKEKDDTFKKYKDCNKEITVNLKIERKNNYD